MCSGVFGKDLPHWSQTFLFTMQLLGIPRVIDLQPSLDT